MNLTTLPVGSRVLDCNLPLSSELARTIEGVGFKGVMRYIARDVSSGKDLSKVEISNILGANLVFGVVQHVESESSWLPTAALGQRYGARAAQLCDLLNLPSHSVVWCDLEGVAPGTDPTRVEDYVRQWAGQVAPNYDPGLYVGWHSDLTPAQLYSLPVKRYWGSYNLNRDEEPATRGLQFKQHSAVSVYGAGAATLIQGMGAESFDVNTVLQDREGDTPLFIGA